LLEMANIALPCNGKGNVCTLTGFCRGGRPWLAKVGAIATWWQIISSGNLSFMKKILVGYLAWGWKQKFWGRFGRWSLRLERRGITSAAGLHDWTRQAVPLLNYTLTFAYNWGKALKSSTIAAE
jgi:hypothetical protein